MYQSGPLHALSRTTHVTGWFMPTAKEKDDGYDVIPSGIPCSMIPTEPAKPFCAVTAMAAGEVCAPTLAERTPGKQRR